MPGAESAFSPGKHCSFLPRLWCGMVPVLPALTRGTFPSIDVIGMTYRRGRPGSSSNNLRVSASRHQFPAAASCSGQTYSSKVEISTHFILYLTLSSLRTMNENTSKHRPYHTLSAAGWNVALSTPSGRRNTASWWLKSQFDSQNILCGNEEA